MITYGKTACPNCKALNSIYRPLEDLRGVWNQVECWNCKHEYKHFNNHVNSIKEYDGEEY